MSLSNPKTKNPAEKHIEWAGSIGNFRYYDKGTSKNVDFKESIYIIPLDVFSTIRGFHDASNSGIYSNEVRYLSNDILNIRAYKGGEIARGLYSDIKGKLEGGKFSKSLYAAMIISQGKDKLPLIELVNIIFTGSSLGVFIDANINVDSGEIVILSPSKEEKKKGNTVYFEPVIQKSKRRDDILESCVSLDVQLQEYMKTYLANTESESVEVKEVKPIAGILPNNDFDHKPDILPLDENGSGNLPF